jgi:hypothetical protein
MEMGYFILNGQTRLVFDGSPNVGADIRLTVVKAEVAELVKTVPASGGDNGEFLPIVLYFD